MIGFTPMKMAVDRWKPDEAQAMEGLLLCFSDVTTVAKGKWVCSQPWQRSTMPYCDMTWHDMTGQGASQSFQSHDSPIMLWIKLDAGIVWYCYQVQPNSQILSETRRFFTKTKPLNMGYPMDTLKPHPFGLTESASQWSRPRRRHNAWFDTRREAGDTGELGEREPEPGHLGGFAWKVEESKIMGI